VGLVLPALPGVGGRLFVAIYADFILAINKAELSGVAAQKARRRAERRIRADFLPRKINNICTACLVDGFLQEKPLIDKTTARRALGEFEDDA
jgi:hypothetical protein